MGGKKRTAKKDSTIKFAKKIGLEEIEKTLKLLKMVTKCNFRNLKLKSREEYLIFRTYFIL